MNKEAAFANHWLENKNNPQLVSQKDLPMDPRIEIEGGILDECTLSLGSSKLEFYPDLRRKYAVTFLVNKKVLDPNDRDKKVRDEITLLHIAVKSLCIELASQLGSFTYVSAETNRKMVGWAKTKGQKIFDWDKIVPFENERGKKGFKFCKTFT